MLIYHFDRITGRLLHDEEGDGDPRDPEAVLVPAFATDIEPPAAPEGMFAAFIDGAWSLVAEPEPEPDPEPELETPEETRRRLAGVLQTLLDTTARGEDFDNIFTAVTYADEPAVPRFQIAGSALRAWRSLVWATGYSIMDAVMAGERPIPTEAELLAEMPPFVPPVIP